VSRLKVALDCDIPERIKEPLNHLYGERGFEFIHVRQLGMGKADDEVWAKAFMQFGGKIAISADKKITVRPNKLFAFQESGLRTYFMEPPWGRQKLNFKAAHLIYWWPAIERHIPTCADGECWQVPITINNADPANFKALRLPDDVVKEFRAKAG
jgi:PIN domain-containing protein